MNKKERTKEIPRVIVPQGAQKRIASHFGVSGETVRKVEKQGYNSFKKDVYCGGSRI